VLDGACDRSKRVLVERLGEQDRVEIGADTDDNVVSEVDDPAKAVVGPQPIAGRGVRMEFNHGLVVLDEKMVRVQP
jgi:hypothetical protein